MQWFWGIVLAGVAYDLTKSAAEATVNWFINAPTEIPNPLQSGDLQQ